MKIFAIAALAAMIAAPAMAEDAMKHDAMAPSAMAPAATESTYVTAADTNKDGKVSMEEAKAATDTKFGTEEAFKAADTNKDGSLEAAEVAAVK